MPIAPLRSKVVGRGAPNAVGASGGGASSWSGGGDEASQLLSGRSFYFSERHEVLDLEAIRGLDLDRIEKDVDIEALQVHLEGLVYGKLEAAPLGGGDGAAAFAKVFRLSQLMIEYLLNVQDVLAEGLEHSSASCAEAARRADRYRAKAAGADVKIKRLRAELKQKRAAAETYQGLVLGETANGGRSRAPPAHLAPTSRPRRSRDDERERDGDSDGAPGGERTVYVSSPDGTTARHVVGDQTTCDELRRRLGVRGKLVLRGNAIARDVVLADAGLRHGDTLLCVAASAADDAAGESADLDARIAALEQSIRGEMAVQVQTQLASLRGSLPTARSPSEVAYGAYAPPAAGAPGCLAGALEDDDDDDDAPGAGPEAGAPPAGGGAPAGDPSLRSVDPTFGGESEHQASAPPGPTPHAGEMRALEKRLTAQMDAIEASLAELASRPSPAAAAAPPPRGAPGGAAPPPRPEAAAPAAPPVPAALAAAARAPTPVPAPLAIDSPASDDGFWHLECRVGTGPAEPAPGGEDGTASVGVGPGEGVGDVVAALASRLDVEIDRVRLRRASDGGDLLDVPSLRHAASAGDVLCHVVRGRLVTDDQTDAIASLRSVLGAGAASEAADPDADAAVETAVASRQAAWRALGTNAGADSSLGQADVSRLEVRLQALHALVASVDNCPGFDDDMVARLSRALETVCDGLPHTVTAAITRIKAHVEERAALLAQRR